MFALLMSFLCVILHTMSTGKSLQLLCILPFGIFYTASSMMFVKNVLAVYIGRYGDLSESGLCGFRKLCPVGFLVVGGTLMVCLVLCGLSAEC